MPSWLYRTEAKGIQAWILGDGRLRSIIGGSDQIIRLEREIARRVAAVEGAELLSASAGGAVVSLADESALRELASTWPALADDICPGLEIVQAWVPRAEGLEGLFAAATRARQRRPSPVLQPGPLTARCGRTGAAAVAVVGGERVDARSRSRGLRDAAHDSLMERLSQGGETPEAVGKDIDAIAEGGRIALVHADGDGIGRYLIRNSAAWTSEPERFQAFSRELQEATRAAAQRAVATTQGDLAPRGGPLRLRPVVLGGDDLTVLVNGEAALAFTRAFVDAFAAETKGRALGEGGAGFTASAGVVFIHPHTPYSRAHHLAESLCRWAKDAGPGHLAFHRVTTSHDAGDWETVLETEYTSPDGRLLTAGPYDAEALDALWALRASAGR